MKTAKLIAFAILVSATARTQQTTIAIRCGTVVDVERKTTIPNAVIVIVDDRIREVGRDVAIPQGAHIVDLSSATVLPGLIDLHCHILGGADGEGRGSAADNALNGVRNASKVLLSGFTTIRDPGGGGPHYAGVSVRDAIDRGWFPGPHMKVAGRFLSITGGHGDNNSVAPEYEVRQDNIVNGAEEMREAVRRDVKFGCDWIKLYATGGFFSAGDDPGQQHFSDEEMNVAVEEATRLGTFVSAHAHGTDGIKAAVRAGVRTIEHGTFLDDEGIGLMKQHGTFLVPTLRTIELLAEDLPEHASEGRRKAHDLSVRHFADMMTNIGRAMERGVRVAFGSDMVSLPHGFAAQELRLHVQAGQSPMEAIRSATIVSAEALGMHEEVGSITAGKFADLIAVRGDPLADVTILEKIPFVMKGGKIYKDEISAR
jgi:imidazolonepropionase-like amidohydrolase